MTYLQFPNLKTLHLNHISLSDVFLGPKTFENSVIPVSLENITLEGLTVDDGGWGPLLTFLAHRAFVENPLHMLKFICGPHMCLEIAEAIKMTVDVPEIADTDLLCPFGDFQCQYPNPDSYDQLALDSP